jgi:hypothetical protein
MTTQEVLKQLENAQVGTRAAITALNGLIVPHDYQDVAGLVAKSALELLNAAQALMQSDDARAFAAIERADELLEGVFDIVDGELDEDEE